MTAPWINGRTDLLSQAHTSSMSIRHQAQPCSTQPMLPFTSSDTDSNAETELGSRKRIKLIIVLVKS